MFPQVKGLIFPLLKEFMQLWYAYMDAWATFLHTVLTMLPCPQ